MRLETSFGPAAAPRPIAAAMGIIRSAKPICQSAFALAEWTASQRELWPLQTLEANGAALNTGEYTELIGDLDLDAFVRASRQTVKECEALRIRFSEQDGQHIQWIAPLGDWSPAILDLSHETNPSEAARDWMAAELVHAFDITETIFSWTLIKLAERCHFWCLIAHQLATDGSARNLVACRMADNYSRLINASEAKTQVPGPLTDLLRDDANYRQSEEFEKGLTYWLDQMADPPALTRLTSRASHGSYMPARRTDPVPASASAAIREIMADTKVSLSGLFVCVATLYLRRLTGASDIIIGLLVGARTTPAARNVPGNVSNTVPIRLKVDTDTTLADLIAQARARVREALTHQRVPLAEIKVGLPSLKGELYAIAVNVMKFDFAPKFGAMVTEAHNLSNGPVDDMSISVFERPADGNLQIALNGNVNRYDAGQLATHYKWFMLCLEHVCRANPATLVDAIDWISKTDRELLIDIGTAPNAPEPGSIDESDGADEPASAREAQISRAFARVLEVDVFPMRANFFRQGGYSLLAVQLISALARELDVKLPLRALFDHPTPRGLTRYLSAPAAGVFSKPDLPFLVLCPHGRVLTPEMIDLCNALQADFCVLLIEYPDWRREWDVLCHVDSYLDHIVAQIRAAAPEPRPLSFVSYSFGAHVAYAASIILAGLGYAIERVGIIDGRSPVMQPLASADRPKQWFKRIVKFALHNDVTRQHQLARLIGINAKKPLVKALLSHLRPMIPADDKNEFLFRMTFYINASIPMQGIRDWAAAITRDARLVAAPITLFRSIENLDNWPYDLGWTELAPNLEIVPLQGDHATILQEHNLAVICSRIRARPTKSVAAAVGPRLDVLALSADASRHGPAVRGWPMPELLRDELLSEMFAATVARTPNGACLTTRDGGLTYAEVDARATAVARGLVRCGAKAGEVVGLWLERGVDVLISQLAIAKTGATWLPFDPDAPVERVGACLDDSGARFLLADIERVQRATGALRCPAIDSAGLIDAADQSSVDARALGATPDHAAYIIYTSGSTGEPKGIAVSNRNICHFLRAMNEVYNITGEDVMFQNASLAFDLSMEQIWLPYMVGASLFVADAETICEIDKLPARLEHAGVTVLDTLPTLLGVLPRDVETLRIIILGGEACAPAIVERWASEPRMLYNTYGPTEATVVATACQLRRGEDVTIGSPIPNYSCYVVDADLAPVGVGVEGELLIGGPGITRGYLRRDDMTARKFIANPFETDGSDPILYRTGDAVEIDTNGKLVFKGRIDDQIKIRGFRVELGEIDARLSDIPGVTIAATVLLNEEDSDRLVAYLVTETEINTAHLREILQKYLPSYMVPMRFERVDALPRLPSGKVDRNALRKGLSGMLGQQAS
jgi:amino acid adenylation domain-containing protein